MAAPKTEVLRKRFVFSNCKRRPLTYLAISRAAGFRADRIRGRMVIEIELHPKKETPRRRKKSSRK